ncbi:hypothetical protein [Parvibaculum sp.]|uniref:hypothetical protein n=1 Tax=Parvibaculum sp. TaxID=2024848 RepID=UPI001DC7E4EF|nr:hypothetical protein [Parvibaculum sp.]MBX3487865.1 hypothetical protein [Parvibaculum sp.]
MMRDPFASLTSSRAKALYIARYMTLDGRQYCMQAIEAPDDAEARRLAAAWDCEGEIILLRVRDTVFVDHHYRAGAAP